MKKTQLFKHFRDMTCIFITLAFSVGIFAATTGDKVIPPEQSGKLYLPSTDVMADLETAIGVARDNNKLTLVIMGGNWCHDSRALASRIYQEPLKTIVEENYETIFVDVGFLSKGKDVISSLGPPIYYATPTVLIVDPVSRQLVNAKNRHRWADAFNISMEESVEYFQLMADTDLSSLKDEKTPVDLQHLITEIDSFEQIQADRLYRAYKVLSPMLKAYSAGNKDAFSEDYWNEVRDFRYKVSADVDTLHAEARKRVAAGEQGVELTFPEYPAFTWQSGS